MRSSVWWTTYRMYDKPYVLCITASHFLNMFTSIKIENMKKILRISVIDDPFSIYNKTFFMLSLIKVFLAISYNKKFYDTTQQ